MEFEAEKEGGVLWELEHGKMPEEEPAGLVQFLDWYLPRLKAASDCRRRQRFGPRSGRWHRSSAGSDTARHGSSRR